MTVHPSQKLSDILFEIHRLIRAKGQQVCFMVSRTGGYFLARNCFFGLSSPRTVSRKPIFLTECGVTVVFIYSRLEISLWGRCRKKGGREGGGGRERDRETERDRERIYHLMDFWSFAITFIFLLRWLRCALILTDK